MITVIIIMWWVRSHTWNSQVLCNASWQIGKLRSRMSCLLVSCRRSLPFLQQKLLSNWFGMAHGFVIVSHCLFSRRVWSLVAAIFSPLYSTRLGAAVGEDWSPNPNRRFADTRKQLKNDVAHSKLMRNVQIYYCFSWLHLTFCEVYKSSSVARVVVAMKGSGK